MFTPMEGLLKHAMPARIWPARKRSAPWSLGPKTAVPGDAGVVAGHRFYSPGLGRWASRDPLTVESARLVASGWEAGRLSAAEMANPFLALVNDPSSRMDLLGLCSTCATGPEVGAGTECCPACEYRAIQAEMSLVLSVIATYAGGTRPTGPGFVRYASTRCFVWPGPTTQYFYGSMRNCIGKCTAVHESVHRQQCLHRYTDFAWAGGYARDIGNEARMEIEAYAAEYVCLVKLLWEAKREAAKFGGNYLRACICCRGRQLGVR